MITYEGHYTFLCPGSCNGSFISQESAPMNEKRCAGIAQRRKGSSQFLYDLYTKYSQNQKSYYI